MSFASDDELRATLIYVPPRGCVPLGEMSAADFDQREEYGLAVGFLQAVEEARLEGERLDEAEIPLRLEALCPRIYRLLAEHHTALSARSLVGIARDAGESPEADEALHVFTEQRAQGAIEQLLGPLVDDLGEGRA